MSDAVVAAATPWGTAALAVVRMSGDDVPDILSRLVRPFQDGPIPPGVPRRVWILDGDDILDDGVVVLGRAPKTYTGETTAELTCHGNPLIVERLLHAAVAAGARMAEPGEFTRRALENGKVDLVRAEAVEQVVHARSTEGLQIARAAMDGRLGTAFDGLRKRLRVATAELEARLDYPGDELAYVDDTSLLDDISAVRDEAQQLADTWAVGRVRVEGARIALLGPVNAGKSSLFNALLGRKRALVHDTPGTTRDVIEASTHLGSVAVTLLDTAGERQTDDPIEAAGLDLAREVVQDADLWLIVLRARPTGPTPVETELLQRAAGRPHVVVYNGVDTAEYAPPPHGAVETVAPTSEGIDTLTQAIERALITETPGAARLVVASARQRDRLIAMCACVDEAIEALPVAGVAVSADALTRGLEELDALTGEDTRERVLDELFARFCIGK